MHNIHLNIASNKKCLVLKHMKLLTKTSYSFLTNCKTHPRIVPYVFPQMHCSNIFGKVIESLSTKGIIKSF